MISPTLYILTAILSPGTSSPVIIRPYQRQLDLLSWVAHQNQLFASGQILDSSDPSLEKMEMGEISHGASTASPLSEWQQAYLEQLQLLATVAAQHQHFISGQTSAQTEEHEEETEEEEEDDSDLTEAESEFEEMEIEDGEEEMEIGDGDEEEEESVEEENSTESATEFTKW